MARPERNTVDYFPHIISEGKKMYFIEAKYGNDGYATWFKILEKIAGTEYHYLDLNKEEELLFLAAKCHINENRLIDIVTDIAKMGGINKELWQNRIVWSDLFIETIQDAYERRKNKCITFEGLCNHLLSLGVHLSGFGTQNDNINTQSKVKESKVKKSKEKDIPSIEEFLAHAMERKPDVDPEAVKLKFQAWLDNEWKTGKDKPIKNWKATLTNTLQFIASQKKTDEKKWYKLIDTRGATGSRSFYGTEAELQNEKASGRWKESHEL